MAIYPSTILTHTHSHLFVFTDAIFVFTILCQRAILTFGESQEMENDALTLLPDIFVSFLANFLFQAFCPSYQPLANDPTRYL